MDESTMVYPRSHLCPPQPTPLCQMLAPSFFPVFTELFMWRGFLYRKSLQHLATRTHRVASCVWHAGHQRPYFLTAYYHTSIKHTWAEYCPGAEKWGSWPFFFDFQSVIWQQSLYLAICLQYLSDITRVSSAPENSLISLVQHAMYR